MKMNYSYNEMKRAFETGRNFQLTGENNFQELIEELNQVLPQADVIRWVAVEEKMPESGQCVLLYSPKSGVGEGAWISTKGHFEQWRWNAILTNVSHWMPMPEPPFL